MSISSQSSSNGDLAVALKDDCEGVSIGAGGGTAWEGVLSDEELTEDAREMVRFLSIELAIR